MNLPYYLPEAGDELGVYAFFSEGPKGKVKKLIAFTRIEDSNVFNLSLVDQNEITGEMDDMVVTNNGDTDKVLGTVVYAMLDFTDKHPEAWIYATGSTQTRTRLYQMGISKHLQEARNSFQILGKVENTWQKFEKEINYTAFLVKRKLSKFEL